MAETFFLFVKLYSLDIALTYWLGTFPLCTRGLEKHVIVHNDCKTPGAASDVEGIKGGLWVTKEGVEGGRERKKKEGVKLIDSCTSQLPYCRREMVCLIPYILKIITHGFQNSA